MRTPWILDRADAETAYVGLGFSPVAGSSRDKQIVFGCSHLYSSTGEGMRYRLSKLDDPVIRGKNRACAARTRAGSQRARQLFYEWRNKLPSRVVFKKRTPFMPEERAGLMDGLQGVEDVEMLEITVEPALRYIASRMKQGKLQDDPFPVRRGAAVVLDNRQALIWVHGATAGLGGKTYYQGKSRIPAPLIITRHHGSGRSGPSRTRSSACRRWTGISSTCTASTRRRSSRRTRSHGSASCSNHSGRSRTTTGCSSRDDQTQVVPRRLTRLPSSMTSIGSPSHSSVAAVC